MKMHWEAPQSLMVYVQVDDVDGTAAKAVE